LDDDEDGDDEDNGDVKIKMMMKMGGEQDRCCITQPPLRIDGGDYVDGWR